METVIRKPNGYWTYDRCADEALKYQTKIDFKKNSMSAYVISVRNGWVDEITKHMVTFGCKHKRCEYAYEFPNNYVYVGLTYNINERQINRDSHLTDTVTKFKISSGLEPIRIQVTEYIPVNEARIMEGTILEKYIKEGWIPLNIKKTGGVGGNTLIWTKNACIDAAKKCRTRTEFHEKYRGAYSSSIKNDWIGEIYLMLKSNKGGKVIHTIESCSNKSILCKTRAEFKKRYIKEFNVAYNHKWLDKICEHMVSGHLKQNKLL